MVDKITRYGATVGREVLDDNSHIVARVDTPANVAEDPGAPEESDSHEETPTHELMNQNPTAYEPDKSTGVPMKNQVATLRKIMDPQADANKQRF